MRDKLVDDFRNKNHTKQDLESRLRLASTLARVVYQFFALGWFHKNIRSSSILFFDPAHPSSSVASPASSSSQIYTQAPHADLSQPYLAGFGLSRQGNGIGTENMPSILKSTTEKKEWQLYIHPQRRANLGLLSPTLDPTDLSTIYTISTEEKKGTPSLNIIEQGAVGPSPTNNLIYDTYSLGMILLEIALWCPLIKLCSRSSSVDEFQASVMDMFEEKVSFNMGRRYANVLKWCLSLSGDPSNSSSEEVVDREKSRNEAEANATAGVNTDEQQAEQDDETQQQFLEVFESVVITELESLIV